MNKRHRIGWVAAPGILALAILIGGALAHGVYDAISATHLAYLAAGTIGALLCYVMVEDKSSRLVGLVAGAFVFIGCFPRLLFGPGFGVLPFNAATFLTSSALYIIAVGLVLFLRRMSGNRTGLLRQAVGALVLLIGFAVPAVAVPLILGEPLLNHRFKSEHWGGPASPMWPAVEMATT